MKFESKTTLLQKRHLYIALSTLWLTACSNGTNQSQNNNTSSAAGLTLNKYISTLSYTPLKQQSIVSKFFAPDYLNGTQQQSFVVTHSTPLANIQIQYYPESNCSGSNIFTTTLYAESTTRGESAPFVILNPGTYNSTGISNFALCGIFESSGSQTPIFNCSQESELVNSISFTYNESGGTNIGSLCLSNSNNTAKNESGGEYIADYSGASPAACTGSASCGFSESYTITLGSACNPCAIFFTPQHNGNFGGIAGADAFCQTSANESPAVPVGTYKAFISDGVNRVACTSANCTTGGNSEHINWIMQPNTKYAWGGNPTYTLWTTNSNGIFVFGHFVGPKPFSVPRGVPGFIVTWTGFNFARNWTSPTVGTSNCQGWTSTTTNSATGLGTISVPQTYNGHITRGRQSSTAPGSSPANRILNGVFDQSCRANAALLCVEQLAN